MSSRIYPAIDIIDGKCVRLKQGDYLQKTDYGIDPLDMALRFQDAGAAYIHIVDLDAAKDPKVHNRPIIESIIKNTRLSVQTGGGIRSFDQVKALREIGADRLIIGSKASTDREEVFKWISEIGGDHIVVGTDVSNGKIATHGWQNITDEDVTDFIRNYLSHDASIFLCTDIAKDGMMSGSSKDLYRMLQFKFTQAKFIASGGVHSLDEVNALRDMEMDSIIVGKAIYEGAITLDSLFN
jgi:phosphoribosylformimino-5-aminoimidazole carboxamide ribotide isomerase